MNKIILSGRLAQEPKQRTTEGRTEMVTFNLAVERNRSDKTDFFKCAAFGQSAKHMLQYGTTGMSLELEGECQLVEYTDSNGAKQKDVNIIAAWFKFTSKNPNQQSGQSVQHQQQNSGNYQQGSPQQQTPTYHNSDSTYQEACWGGQSEENGCVLKNGRHLAPPVYIQPPKTDYLKFQDGVDDDDYPFN